MKAVTVLNVIHSFIPLEYHFSTESQSTDEFVLSWHEFKIRGAVETGHLHLVPFMNSHFQFLIIVECAMNVLGELC